MAQLEELIKLMEKAINTQMKRNMILISQKRIKLIISHSLRRGNMISKKNMTQLLLKNIKHKLKINTTGKRILTRSPITYHFCLKTIKTIQPMINLIIYHKKRSQKTKNLIHLSRKKIFKISISHLNF